MSDAPKTRGFEAWINLQPPGPFNLIVKGEVETRAGNILPRLTRAVPQGIVPTQLILDLSIEDTGGVGTQAFDYRPVRYEEQAEAGDFDSVAIRWGGDIIETLKVNEVH